ncbi:hypothetical protein X801_02797 [Opisthorchis viverrini]|uniref:Uncharacterized protein n=1 Tax=Opisthorchis viverrini TaxID=6198 RepID=A0A1S8X3L1_OPIVI|nr:hypothetical protein X801_02797 [Opisthorchis viverrini]
MPPKTMNTQRALGIEWDPSSDIICFRFHTPEKPLTRRGIPAAVCSLFDPLGLVSPAYVTTKQLLQELCKTGLGWDFPSIGVVQYSKCLPPGDFVGVCNPEFHVSGNSNQTVIFCTPVANRLAIIQEYSSRSEWKHAKSSQNPAHLASRGLKGRDELSR